MAIEEEIELEVKALETCAYSNAVFTEILGKIQKAVDNLSLHSYSNLPQWVAKLDQRVSVDTSDISVGLKKQKIELNVYMLKIMYIYTCVCALICDSLPSRQHGKLCHL